MADQPKEGSDYWKTALIAPPVIIVIGSLISFIIPRSENDWLGLGLFFGIFISIFLAAVIAGVAGAISLFKREPKAGECMITFIPAILFLLLIIPRFIEAHQKRQVERELRHRRSLVELETAQIRVRLVKDEPFRHELLQKSSFKPVEMQAIMTEEVVRLLDENEIQRLWGNRNSNAYAAPYLLIGNTNASPDMLRDYYREILERGGKRKGGFQPRTLAVNHKTLLLHPNLPADLIAEIHGFHEPDVDELLMKNPQFKAGSAKPAKD